MHRIVFFGFLLIYSGIMESSRRASGDHSFAFMWGAMGLMALGLMGLAATREEKK